jgi:hypothetical protein
MMKPQNDNKLLRAGCHCKVINEDKCLTYFSMKLSKVSRLRGAALCLLLLSLFIVNGKFLRP